MQIVKSTQQLDSAKQLGFTYIELLIALSIGLLIIAAIIQVFYSTADATKVQTAHADLQDNMVFSTNFVKKQIRKANMGALSNQQSSGQLLTQKTVYGGVVMTSPDKAFGKIDNTVSTNLHGIRLGNTIVDKNLLSRSGISISNVKSEQSDQLTILYWMPVQGQYDCQGRAIPKGYYVIERYFVRKDKKSMALACASSNFKTEATSIEDITQWTDISTYTKPNGKKVTSYFAGNGSVIVPNVDFFRVLYGISNVLDASNKGEHPFNDIEYIAANGANQVNGFDQVTKRIVNVRFGLLMHSQDNIADNNMNKKYLNQHGGYHVLDKQNLIINTDQGSGAHKRQVLESTIWLRNARAIY